MFEVKIILIIFFVLIITISGISAQPPEEFKSNLEKLRKDFASIIGPVDEPTIGRLIQCVDPSTPRCTPEQRTEILNEVSLWLKFVNHDSPCDPATNEIISNPPVRGDESVLYTTWQQSLINSGQSICNPLNHLTCGNSSKCECMDTELIWGGDKQIGPTPGICLVPLGGDCSAFPSRLNFNNEQSSRLLKYRNIFSATPLAPDYRFLTCAVGTPGSECTSLDYFPQLVCTSNPKPTVIPVDGVTGPVDLEALVKYFHDARTLGHGENCNFDEQNRLFTFPTEEETNVSLRIKNLTAMKTAGAKFCKLQEFQACYPSNKCECIQSTTYNSTLKECRLPTPDADCLHFFNRISSNIDTGFEYTVPGIQEVIRPKLLQIPHTCIQDPKKSCYSPGIRGAQCECKDLNFTGPTCQIKFTSLIQRQGPVPYPTDVTNYEEKEKLFQELNRAAIEFEKGLTGPPGSNCDMPGSRVARQVVVLFSELANSNTRPKRKVEYESLIKLFPVAAKNITGQKVCQPHLVCDLSSRTCVTPLLTLLGSGSSQIDLPKFIIALFIIVLI